MPRFKIESAPAITAWLLICCALVFATVVLGAAVRLSGAGLSMVDWRPLAGALPPLSDSAWQQAFAQYRQFPEFKLVNPDLTLAGFQFIFWMEYAHRMLGRIIGLAFLIPFLFFLATGKIPRPLGARLWALFALGGAQGLLGWYMVKSGLVDDPRVSHYRLASHFMLAVAIYAYMLRVAVGISPMARDEVAAKNAGTVAVAMLLITMLSGALVAGSRAGYIFNTWPLMDGAWIPRQLFAMQPWWLNFTENTVAIQFVHRWLAFGALIAVAVFARQLLRAGERGLGYVLLALAAAQIMLGIATLLLRVPAALGVAHQAGAMLLLTAAVAAVARRMPTLIKFEPRNAP